MTRSKEQTLGRMASEISHNYPLMEVMGYLKLDSQKMVLQKENEILMPLFASPHIQNRDYVD
jgi:hypothetical protein